MKNYSFYILLYLAVTTLSGCAVTKQQAPIEYHHGSSNLGDSKSLNENTVTVVSNDGEIISSKPEIEEMQEVIKPNLDNENYIVPESKPVELNYKIIEHHVKEEETIQEITANYQQTVNEIAEINDLSPPYNLEEFQILKIKVPKDFIQKPIVTIKSKEIPAKQLPEAADYIPPVTGTVIAKFGQKTEHGTNKGINISADEGTKVVASASGKVIYADYDATFGNLVIIKLDNKNIVLSYAHLASLIVAKGATLKQGDIVGYVGHTGKVKQPQLHFAIREGKNAVDPLKFVNY
ncbi:M23 family metallopeptidase [Candidatus Megaera polyxenophila]|nr:M23 family metallopeptidase [Candidatus Megaera polyxenophila]